MKAIALNITYVLIGTLIVALLGIALTSQIPAAKGFIAQVLQPGFSGCGKLDMQCCSGGWCDSPLSCINGLCYDPSSLYYEIGIDERYLLYNATETNTRVQREAYLHDLSGLGWGDCSNAASCQNCSKIFNFSDNQNCMDCSLCDPSDGTCNNCWSCATAENGRYGELNDCYNCSSCSGLVQSMADTCTKCSSCNMVNKTLSYETGLGCKNCNQCDPGTGKCYGCYNCDMPKEKVCDVCSKSSALMATDCNVRHDTELCKKVKECLAFYDGEPCEIDAMISMPWNSGYGIESTISGILDSCIDEDLMYTTPEGVDQKVCKYKDSKMNFATRYYSSDPSSFTPQADLVKMITSDYTFNGVTGENKGILFNDCGAQAIHENNANYYTFLYNDPEMFASSTAPKTPEGDIPINVKIVIPNISWYEQADNDCAYNIHVCAQEAIAAKENDTIMNFYRAFAYLNLTNYTFDNNTEPVAIKDPTIGDTQVNVTGERLNFSLMIDLNGTRADVQQIAKALVAGIRDYFIFNSIYNQTVEFFCVNTTHLYSDMDSCYNNNVSVILNDNVPWVLSRTAPPLSLSEIQKYKYIIYEPTNPSYSGKVFVNLTFIVYTSNISKINNTIMVSPMIFIAPTPTNVFATAAVTSTSSSSSASSSLLPPTTITQQQTLSFGTIGYGTLTASGATTFKIEYIGIGWGVIMLGTKTDMLGYADQIESTGQSYLAWTQMKRDIIANGGEVAMCKSGAWITSTVDDIGTQYEAKTICNTWQGGFESDVTLAWFDGAIQKSNNMIDDATKIRVFANGIP
jgi:hypothetical protein